MLKARWHLGYLARVPVLPPHQLQPLWLPYVPKGKQDTRWMSVMSWLKGMLVFAWGTAEFSHWWHGMLAIMEHGGKRKNQSFYNSGMKLHNVTSSWGEVSQISTVQLPTFLVLWNTGKSYAKKGPAPSTPITLGWPLQQIKQEKKKEAEVQPDMDLRENPENRKMKTFNLEPERN